MHVGISAGPWGTSFPARTSPICHPHSDRGYDRAVLGGSSQERVEVGRFELIRSLGQGGMGVVYEALDRQSGARVALKTLTHASPQLLHRLKKEFRALQRIDHPNLVSLDELIEHEGRWFIRMELIRGVDFLTHVRTISPGPASGDADTMERPALGFDRERIVGATSQLAAGLVALHNVGLVHRDIKPSNVLVTSTGRVVILDFGLVADVAGQYQSIGQNVVGTAAYMAPEQAAMGDVGPAADWYSLGVMLYQALVGALPHAGAPMQVMLAKQQQLPPAPGTLIPGIPEELDHLCLQLLAVDPAARPGAAAVLGALGVGGGGHPTLTRSFSTATSVLVGRDSELTELIDAADRSSQQAVTVVIRGKSGLGKSALLEQLARDLLARDPRTLVLAGRCFENESVPYKAFDGVFDDLATEMLRLPKADAAGLVPRAATLLPRIFPVMARVEVIARAPALVHEPHDRIEERRRLFASVRELFDRIAERRPLVVLLEDMHWSDAESLLLLQSLLDDERGPAALFAMTLRDEYATPELPGEVRTVQLGPLEPDAARRLAKKLLSELSPDSNFSPAQLATETGGHPLYIAELARYLASSEKPERMRLDDAIWHRVERLPAAARLLVELTATAGVPIATDSLRAASELAPEEFERQVRLLRMANLLRSAGSRREPALQTYHDRVRETVVARLDQRAARERHQRLAIGLELNPNRDAEALARHRLATDDVTGAAQALREAATNAANALAFERAAGLLRAIDDLGTTAVSDRRELYEELGTMLMNAGRGAEAAEAFKQAVPGANPAAALRLRMLAATQLLASGYHRAGRAASEEVVREVGLSLPRTPRAALRRFVYRRLRIRLRGYRFQTRDASEIPASTITRIDTARQLSQSLGVSDSLLGSCFHCEALLMSLRAGEPSRVAVSLLGEATYQSLLGGTRAAAKSRRLLDRARALIQEMPPGYLHGYLLGTEGLVAFNEGRIRAAHDFLEQAEKTLRNHPGERWSLTTVQLFRVTSLLVLGELRSSLEQATAFQRDARLRGDLYMETTLQAFTGGYRALIEDRPDRARANLDQAIERWTNDGYHLQHINVARSRCFVSMYEGDHERAHHEIEDEWPAIRRSMLLRAQFLRVMMNSTRGLAAQAVGTVDGNRLARRCRRMLARETSPDAASYGSLLDAGFALAAGEREEAARASERVTDHSNLLAASAARYAVHVLREGAGSSGARAVLAALSDRGIRAPRKALRPFIPWLSDDGN